MARVAPAAAVPLSRVLLARADKDYAPTLGVRKLFEERFGEDATRDSIPNGWVCDFDRQAVADACIPAHPNHLM